MSTAMQREAKALGDPSRNAIFGYLTEAPAPVGVAELATFAGLNHNAVRHHLAVLKGAGLVTEEHEVRARPGRPRMLYRIHPEAAGSWGTPGPYEYLAGLLSEALREGVTAKEVGRRAGLRQAAEATEPCTAVGPGSMHGPSGATGAAVETPAASSAASNPVSVVEGDLAHRGFRPERSDDGSNVDFVLGRCPFEEVAATSPDLVCQLHQGMVEGLVEGLGGVEVVRLVAKNPHQAGCRVVLHPDPST